MPNGVNDLSFEEADKLFSYDSTTGNLIRKVRAGKCLAGSVAGNSNGKGHLRLHYNKVQYYVHRVCWLLYYGEPAPRLIDHINGNGEDNRIDNLRLATNRQNMYNMKLTKRNTSGVKGVSWHKATSKWRATISENGRHKQIGLFSSIEEAREAMVAYREKAHKGYFNHG